MTSIDNDIMDTSPTVKQPMFPTIRIYELVEQARQQHGIRHGNYYRYRTYCAARVCRIRKTAKCQNVYKGKSRHNSKFIKKWITQDCFNNESILISVFDAERSWSQAMFDKQILEDYPDKLRKRHNMSMNLKRAVRHANEMEALVRRSLRCDPATKLEAIAYSSWLLGICYLEHQEWQAAGVALNTARSIYERLADTTSYISIHDIYKDKCREIFSRIRLCDFNSTESMKSMSEFVEKHLQLNGEKDFDVLFNELEAKNLVVTNVTNDVKSSDVTDEKQQRENIRKLEAFYKKQLKKAKKLMRKEERINEGSVETEIKYLPTFESVSNKPIFFDLSLNYIRLPNNAMQLHLKTHTYENAQIKNESLSSSSEKISDSEEEVQEQNQFSISGMVKGWFGFKS